MSLCAPAVSGGGVSVFPPPSLVGRLRSAGQIRRPCPPAEIRRVGWALTRSGRPDRAQPRKRRDAYRVNPEAKTTRASAPMRAAPIYDRNPRGFWVGTGGTKTSWGGRASTRTPASASISFFERARSNHLVLNTRNVTAGRNKTPKTRNIRNNRNTFVTIRRVDIRRHLG